MKSISNPKHIAGIYNYCDRWCERCSFTSKCAVYENTSNLSPEQNDINNKAFWDHLSKSFSEVITMIQEDAKKRGIEIELLADAEWEEYLRLKKAGRVKADNHPLIKYAKAYTKQATLFFKTSEFMKRKVEALVQQVELGIIQTRDVKKEFAEITDCFDILQWYVYLIHVKFLRAMPLIPGQDKAFIKDSNGSAKVALICADRCIMAWQKILQFLPDAEDEILSMLALLQKIVTIGEQTFPNARKFKRPGLDK